MDVTAFPLPAGEGVVRAVSLTDELALAMATKRLGGIGRDLVHRAVNAVVADGARPIAMTCQYLGAQHADAIIRPIVDGATSACRELGVALSGFSLGKSSGGAYLTGAILGVKRPLVDPRPGDSLVGLRGVGLHSCGFAFARAVVFGRMGLRIDDDLPATGTTVAGALLEVRRCFGPAIDEAIDRGIVRGLISTEETPLLPGLRSWLRPGLAAQLDLSRWEMPGLVEILMKTSGRTTVDAAAELNLGVGMIGVVARTDVDALVRIAEARGVPAKPIGTLVEGDQTVTI